MSTALHTHSHSHTHTHKHTHYLSSLSLSLSLSHTHTHTHSHTLTTLEGVSEDGKAVEGESRDVGAAPATPLNVFLKLDPSAARGQESIM